MEINVIMNDLHRCGYFNETADPCGSSLSSETDPIDPKLLIQMIQNQWLGKKVCCLRSVSSTNDILEKLGEQGVPHGTVVTADYQSAGRGRAGRSWSAPSGSGLLFSYLIRPEIEAKEIPLITLAAAVGTARGLEKATGIRPGIKWPNDIIFEGRKVAGILAEARFEHSHPKAVVVGVGINMHLQTHEWPAELTNKAISVFQITGVFFKRQEVLQAVCEENEREIERLIQGDPQIVLNNWLAYSATIGQVVDVVLPNEVFRATACALNQDGGLIVQDEFGVQRTIYMGDISLRHVNRGCTGD